ncbi:MAG: hypothetical protein ACOYMV_09985, partial [Verrucomicrobiia bacterium]
PSTLESRLEGRCVAVRLSAPAAADTAALQRKAASVARAVPSTGPPSRRGLATRHAWTRRATLHAGITRWGADRIGVVPE